jgi:hypothetical protein
MPELAVKEPTRRTRRRLNNQPNKQTNKHPLYLFIVSESGPSTLVACIDTATT